MAVRKRLSKAVVDAMKPRRSDYTVWDEDVPRLGLRVRPSGGKHYVLRLVKDGRQRWYTIGKHGDPWTPETARVEAQRVTGQAAHVDALRETGGATPSVRHPIEAREAGKATPTVAEFAERYLTDHADAHKAPATAEADRGLLGLRKQPNDKPKRKSKKTRKAPRTILSSALADIRVDRVTRADVTRFHLSWQDTPIRANRALALLSHMFKLAEKWGLRPEGSNPCRYVDRFEERARERFLSAGELSKLGDALARHERKEKLTPYGLAAVRLLTFTGARASEVLGLTWDGVDLGSGTVRLAESKTGPKTLFLNPPAQSVLASLPRERRNPYVIVGGRAGQALTLSGLEQVWQEVRKTAGLADVRLHDLRHSFASVAAAGGASLPVIGALLGHARAETTKRYAHLAESPLKDASKAIGQSIAAAMRGTKRGNVTPMRKRGAR